MTDTAIYVYCVVEAASPGGRARSLTGLPGAGTTDVPGPWPRLVGGRIRGAVIEIWPRGGGSRTAESGMGGRNRSGPRGGGRAFRNASRCDGCSDEAFHHVHVVRPRDFRLALQEADADRGASTGPGCDEWGVRLVRASAAIRRADSCCPPTRAFRRSVSRCEERSSGPDTRGRPASQRRRGDGL